MFLKALDIPEFGSERDAWFDERLAGGDLPELVAELLALLGQPLRRPDGVPALDEWLGTRRDAFLTGGVAALTESQRRDLTRYPWLLLDLQAAIDASGGDHWIDVALRSPDFAAAVAEDLPSIDSVDETESLPEGANGAESLSQSHGTSRRKFWAVAAVAISAAAVAVLWLRGQSGVAPSPPAGGWGWNQRDLFAGSPTPDEYLNRLADAGAKWRNKRPESKSDVGQRIRELRAGCQRLIDGNHPPLSTDQETALKTLCQKWAGQFDTVLADLDADRRTPLEARSAIDEVVDKLVTRLRSGKLS